MKDSCAPARISRGERVDVVNIEDLSGFIGDAQAQHVTAFDVRLRFERQAPVPAHCNHHARLRRVKRELFYPFLGSMS